MCNADAYFALGKSHTVCQDYAAVTQGYPQEVRIAVSDGCSSSPDTDFGARFLVRTAMGIRSRVLPHPDIIASRAWEPALALDLPGSVMDATLLIADVWEGTLTIHAFGDGVIDLEFKNGDRSTYSIEFSNEAPAYLSYWLREDDLDMYLKKFGCRKVSIDVSFPDGSGYSKDIEERVTRESYGYVQKYPWNTVKRVTLCTDGVRSFRKVTSLGATEAVPLEKVLAEVTAIKSPAGAFMVRRMRRFLYDFCPKNGWYHDDDVGVATILNGGSP